MSEDKKIDLIENVPKSVALKMLGKAHKQSKDKVTLKINSKIYIEVAQCNATSEYSEQWRLKHKITQ